MPPSRPDSSLPSSSAAELAGPGRLEAMTLRCDRATRRRVDAAWKQARAKRTDLSLGRFLAERIVVGLGGGAAGSDATSVPASPLDMDLLSEIVAISATHAVDQAFGNEMAPLGERLATIEKTLNVMADLISGIAHRLSGQAKP